MMKKKKDRKPKVSAKCSKTASDSGNRINQPIEVSKEDFDGLVKKMLEKGSGDK